MVWPATRDGEKKGCKSIYFYLCLRGRRFLEIRNHVFLLKVSSWQFSRMPFSAGCKACIQILCRTIFFCAWPAFPKSARIFLQLPFPKFGNNSVEACINVPCRSVYFWPCRSVYLSLRNRRNLENFKSFFVFQFLFSLVCFSFFIYILFWLSFLRQLVFSIIFQNVILC